MEKIQQELSAAVKQNFALLGLDIQDPTVTCSCTITPGAKNVIPPASAFVKPDIPSVESQFVHGASISGNIPLSPFDPGNVPFILPGGVTADSVIAKQQEDAQKALKVAEDAATEASKQLALRMTQDSAVGGATTRVQAVQPVPVKVTVSVPSLAINTSATSAGDTVPGTSMITSNNILDTTSGLVTTAGVGSITGSTIQPLVEGFEPRSHTIRQEPGGYGFCGKLTRNEMLLVIIAGGLAWYFWTRRRGGFNR